MTRLRRAAHWAYQLATRRIWAELAAITLIAIGAGLWIFDPIGRALIVGGVLLEILVTVHDPDRRPSGNNPQ